MKAILAIGLVIALAGCTDAQNAHRVLSNAGYSDVQITGYQMFGCARETRRTGFTAKSPSGVYVSGIVCQDWGWLSKAATIRFE